MPTFSEQLFGRPSLKWLLSNVSMENRYILEVNNNETTKATVRRGSLEIVFLKSLKKSQGNICARVSILPELQASSLQYY